MYWLCWNIQHYCEAYHSTHCPHHCHHGKLENSPNWCQQCFSIWIYRWRCYIHPTLPNIVCKLHKALYKLKQAPRVWFSHLSNQLLELQFSSSKSNSSLILYRKNGVTIHVLIYVDDIITTSSHEDAISKLITNLQNSFAIKDLDQLHFFLGVEATWTADGLHLSQQRYIHDLQAKTNILLAKPISSPMSASSTLSKYEGSTITDPTLYRSTLGSL